MTGMGGNLQPYGDHLTWSDGNAYMGVFRDGTSGGPANYGGTGGAAGGGGNNPRQAWNMTPYTTTGWFMMAFVRNGAANTWNAYVADSGGTLGTVDSTNANDFGLGSVFELGRNQGNSQADRTVRCTSRAAWTTKCCSTRR